MKTMPSLTPAYLYDHCGCRLKRSLPRIILGLVLVLLGMIALLAPSTFGADETNAAVGLMTAGVVALIVGIYFALFKNKSWIYEPTGSHVSHSSMYFSAADKERACHFVDTAQTTDMPPFRHQGKLMLDVFSSADDSMVCMQLCEYSNFNYEPVTSPRVVTGEQASVLGRKLKEEETA